MPDPRSEGDELDRPTRTWAPRRLPDSPVATAVVAGLVASALVVGRWAIATRRTMSGFVLVGQQFATRPNLPGGIRPVAGPGYDGQFFYRLARSPFNFRTSALGIRIDTGYRFQRIGYPLLGWVVSLGHQPWVPVALVVINIVGLAVIAGLAGRLAQQGGWHTSWGLIVAADFGFVFVLGRDLSEIVAAALAVAGLVAIRGRRPWLAGAALAAAALTRETSLLVPAAYGLVRVGEMIRYRSRPRTDDAIWILPAVAFVTWQVIVHAATGVFPLSADSRSNLAVPFRAMVHATAKNLTRLPDREAALWLGELAVLVALGVASALALRSSSSPPHEKVAWGLALLLLAAASGAVWGEPSDFRSFAEFFVLSWVVLFGGRRTLRLPATLCGCAWGVIALHRVVNL